MTEYSDLSSHGLVRNLVNARQMTPGWTGHPTSDRASIATEADALQAIVWLGGQIDELCANDSITLETAEALCALLLIARDYVLPLPEQRDAFDPDRELAAARLTANIEGLRKSPM